MSESSYTEEINARTFVGDAQDGRRLLVLDLKTGDAVWAALDGSASRAREASAAAIGGADPEPAAKDEPPAAKGRDVRWTTLLPSPDGRRLVASVRAADNTDRWLVRVDPATGRSTVLDHVHDDAWVRDVGPNGSYGGGLGWLPDSRRVWFLAEHDGWMQLYTVDASAEAPARWRHRRPLRDRQRAGHARRRARFLLKSTEVHPGERHLYAVAVSGGARTRLTPWPAPMPASSRPTARRLDWCTPPATSRPRSI